MIKEFLTAIFAPNKMMQAIEGLREENARLRHELRHYTEYSYQKLIEPHLRSNPDYIRAMYRSCWQRIAGALAERNLFAGDIVPLSAPEKSGLMYGEPKEKLVMRVLVRTPSPMLQGVPVPCEEDPDWVIEEYALQIRAKDPEHLKRPFLRISLMKRMSLENLMPSYDSDVQELVSRVAVVRFERDGTPYVVSR